MSDLDKKLRNILLEAKKYSGHYDHDTRVVRETATKIKQAFIDAGWVDLLYRECTHHELRDKQCELGHDTKACLLCGHVYHKAIDEYGQHLPETLKMTGQEWYDRFEKALKGQVFPYEDGEKDVLNALHQCDVAAKKASGINQ